MILAANCAFGIGWGWRSHRKQIFMCRRNRKKRWQTSRNAVVASTTDFGFVPESATPLNLLTTFSILLNKGKKIHPFVVKKILDKETGEELLLSRKDEPMEQSDSWSDAEGNRIESLFRSQASQGAVRRYFFRDDISGQCW